MFTHFLLFKIFLISQVGLILSGMEDESLHLLQKYIDLSGDVQTVAWLSVRCMGTDLAKSPQPQDWFHCYGELLNSWRMWMKRAEFEVAIGDACMFKAPPQQVSFVLTVNGLPTIMSHTL